MPTALLILEGIKLSAELLALYQNDEITEEELSARWAVMQNEAQTARELWEDSERRQALDIE